MLTSKDDPEDLIKIVTMNVTSLRNSWSKGISQYIQETEADIVCMQETKMYDGANVPTSTFQIPNFHGYFFHAVAKKGYAGTAIYTKFEPLSVQQSWNDQNGRCITMEFEKFYLVNTYVPNAGDKLQNLSSKIQTWEPRLAEHLAELSQTKPPIWCGDLNVAHKDIDIFKPEGHEKTAGFTPEERTWFDNFLKSGYVDVFRKLYPDKQEFTFFSFRGGARQANRGWRLDYFVIPQNVWDSGIVSDCRIENGPTYTDHLPLSLFLKKELFFPNGCQNATPGITVLNTNTSYSPNTINEINQEITEGTIEEPKRKPRGKKNKKKTSTEEDNENLNTGEEKIEENIEENENNESIDNNFELRRSSRIRKPIKHSSDEEEDHKRKTKRKESDEEYSSKPKKKKSKK